MRLLPGGPFDEEVVLPPETKTVLLEKYQLHKPIGYQYTHYMSQLIQGNLGESYKYRDKKVSQLIIDSLPTTLALGFMSLVLSFAIGIVLGVLSLGKNNVWGEKIIPIFLNGGSSLPSFLSAPILILIFSFYFNIFPPALWSGPEYYVLPVLALSLRPLCLIGRLVRTSGLDNIQSDFVRTALAKGVSEKTILFKHILRNSLMPLLSISGSIIAQVLSGSFIIEQIFAIPGISHHLIESVSNRDYPVLMGLSLIYVFILVLANFISDILALIVDPRLRPQ